MTSRDEPTYGIEIRVADGLAEIALVAHVPGADGRPADVWSHRFASVRAAGLAVGSMVKLRREWGRWGRMASLLGPDFLDGVMDGDLLAVASSDHARRRSDRSGTSLRSESGRPRATIRMRLSLEAGESCIVASREGRTFMRLALPTPLQARRVWDWLRWQTDRYRSMFEFHEREGAPALVVLIVAEVMEAERRAMLVHGPRDPERPLRHWRPSGLDPDPEAWGEGSDDAVG